jgi:hypothetical protein
LRGLNDGHDNAFLYQRPGLSGHLQDYVPRGTLLEIKETEQEPFVLYLFWFEGDQLIPVRQGFTEQRSYSSVYATPAEDDLNVTVTTFSVEESGPTGFATHAGLYPQGPGTNAIDGEPAMLVAGTLVSRLSGPAAAWTRYDDRNTCDRSPIGIDNHAGDKPVSRHKNNRRDLDLPVLRCVKGKFSMLDRAKILSTYFKTVPKILSG